MKMKFKVLRRHQGDRMYMPGDVREIAEAEVKHLVARGVLLKMDEPVENKAEPGAEQNAAEVAAPHNKSRKRKASDA